jgi:serine/threonine protein kinase
MAVDDDDPALGVTRAADATIEDSAATDSGRAEPRLKAIARDVNVGRYQLLDRLGAGAMGEVWSAYDPQLDRKVAIKLVHPRLARTRDIAVRMLREARAMAKVSDRSVITVHDAGESDGRLFIAMELVRGRTLGAILRERMPNQLADWRRWLAMLLDAGRGLAAAHAAGVLHRDFKPDNVLVDSSGRVCVGDFGLASLSAAPRGRTSIPVLDTTPDPALTVTGALLGTPAYMSPEQLYGLDIDARADEFSFCVAAYEALYGTRPFAIPADERGNLAALVEAIEQRAISPAPSSSNVPPEVRAALIRGLAPSAGERWPDLAALLAALEPFVAAPSGTRPHRARWPRVLTGVAVAGLVLAIVAIVLHTGRTERTPARDHASQPALRPSEPDRPIETVSLRAALALSPRGLLAIGTNRVQVLDLDHDSDHAPRWQVDLPSITGHAWTERLQLDGEEAVRWCYADIIAMGRWAFAAHREPEPLPPPGPAGSLWIGGDEQGEFVQLGMGPTLQIAFVRAEQVVRTWSAGTAFDPSSASVAPGHRRLAYLEPIDLYTSRIIVLDASTGAALRGDPIVGLASIAWRTDELLLFGTSGDTAAIEQMPVGDTFGGATPVLRAHEGDWIGVMVANRDRVVYGKVLTESRARLVSDDATKRRDFEPAVAAAPLGWRPDGKFVVWNRTNLEIRDPGGASTMLNVALPHEPQSATFAGNLMIVTMRGTTGRTIAAYDLAATALDKMPRWNIAEGLALTVRCAGDVRPPCYIARQTAPATYDIVPLDPATGTAGGEVRYHGQVEDFAVHRDGEHLLVVPPGGRSSTVVTELGRDRSRTVAFPLTLYGASPTARTTRSSRQARSSRTVTRS